MRKNLLLPKKGERRHFPRYQAGTRCTLPASHRKTPALGVPEVALLGEEGIVGNAESDCRWVVDPIDGTVNFTYGIPHACVSIALQERAASASQVDYEDGYRTVVGVVYDPFCDELWTAIRCQPTRLNGKIIRVSKRTKLADSVVSIGFAKNRANLERALPVFRVAGAPREEDSHDGRGRAGIGLRGQRPVRRVYRTRRELVGYRSGRVADRVCGRGFLAPTRAGTAPVPAGGQQWCVAATVAAPEIIGKLAGCFMRRYWSIGSLVLLLVTLRASCGTLAQFRTVFGDIDVELYDQEKPVTVQNFKNLVSSGAYRNTFFHRVIPGFAAQGGGFFTLGAFTNLFAPPWAPLVQSRTSGQLRMNTMSG